MTKPGFTMTEDITVSPVDFLVPVKLACQKLLKKYFMILYIHVWKHFYFI